MRAGVQLCTSTMQQNCSRLSNHETSLPSTPSRLTPCAHITCLIFSVTMIMLCCLYVLALRSMLQITAAHQACCLQVVAAHAQLCMPNNFLSGAHLWYHHSDALASSTFIPNNSVPDRATIANTRMVSKNAFCGLGQVINCASSRAP
mmetsp:Transcript_26495/g.57815  ORF Transcript_26495/g.57815 Transcript_26495/m.57815 type:complete len:147 (-) Transcript_26495:306-746(-)